MEYHPAAVSTTERPEFLPAGAGLAAPIANEMHGGDVGDPGTVAVRARGYWEQVWIRFRRDKVAITGGIFIIFLLFAAFAGAPIAAHFLGHGPNDQFFYGGVNQKTFLPVGPWTWFKAPDGTRQLFILGSSDTTGRDEFLRLLYGARVSLEIACIATIVGMIIGVTLGATAGYFGGWIDTIISRLTELVMAFPILLFAIALGSTVGPRLNGITLGFLGKGVLTLVIVISLVSWFYPARIIRAQVLSLREKEFIEAARM